MMHQWGIPSDMPVLVTPGPSPVRSNTYDIRDYLPLRVGDYSVRQDGYTEITLRTERDSARNLLETLIRGFQGGNGSVNDDVFGVGSNGNMRMWGSYRGIPRVYYRYTAPVTVGTPFMRVGDTFNNTYTVTNTNTRDTTTETFNGTFAAIETVITPAGTFDNCMKYTGSNEYGTWTAWFAPGVGQVKEITSGGTENPAVYIVAGNVAYGTPPALAISNVSGMFDLDSNNAGGTSSTRWEKNIYNIVHDPGTGNLNALRFRPDGTQAPRTGTLTDNSAFTMTGLNSTGLQLTVSGVFTPDGKHLVGRWWLDSAPDVQYAFAGNIINAGPDRITGDENISVSTCTSSGYYRQTFTGPVKYSGYDNAYRMGSHGSLVPGPPSSWNMAWSDPEGSVYMVGDSESGEFIPPILFMPSRFVLDNVYTTYNLGGDDTLKIKIDAVQNVSVPKGTYLSTRMNLQDNVAGIVTNSYQWSAPGVHMDLRWTDPGCIDSLAWYMASGNTFGNKPTTTPFSFMYTNGSYLYLRDESDGTKRYWYDVEVKTPGGGMVTDNTTVRDVKVYAWPAMTPVLLQGSWTTWRAPNLYYDGDGDGANLPSPLPYSGIEGYLDNTGALLPGFYAIVATDNTGQQQANWLYHEAPTEVGKVQFSTMSQTIYGDNTVKLSWGLPNSPPPNPAKHIVRLYVYSSNDISGNGSWELLLTSNLSATTDSYTIPAAEVARLKSPLFSPLYWQVRIRESDPNVTNPDGSIRSYNIYSNNGPYKSLILP